MCSSNIQTYNFLDRFDFRIFNFLIKKCFFSYILWFLFYLIIHFFFSNIIFKHLSRLFYIFFVNFVFYLHFLQFRQLYLVHIFYLYHLLWKTLFNFLNTVVKSIFKLFKIFCFLNFFFLIFTLWSFSFFINFYLFQFLNIILTFLLILCWFFSQIRTCWMWSWFIYIFFFYNYWMNFLFINYYFCILTSLIDKVIFSNFIFTYLLFFWFISESLCLSFLLEFILIEVRIPAFKWFMLDFGSKVSGVLPRLENSVLNFWWRLMWNLFVKYLIWIKILFIVLINLRILLPKATTHISTVNHFHFRWAWIINWWSACIMMLNISWISKLR